MLSIIFALMILMGGCVMGFGIGMLIAVLVEEGVELELVKLDNE